MFPFSRSVSLVVYPILLVGGVAGIFVIRNGGFASGIFATDPTGTLKEAVEREQDVDLERFYQRSGYAPIWQERKNEVVDSLRAAANHGLRSEDYLQGQDDLALTKGLLRLVGDLRYGRNNPGTYEKLERNGLGDLAWNVARYPGGIEAGLYALDPPFAEYKRLQDALGSATLDEWPRIEQTMERWRWLPRSFEHGAILVNVPEFRLRVLDENHNTVLDMKMIVGDAKHETPLFTATLKSLVFGPYWNVPNSIIKNEIVPALQKNRSYLTLNNYQILSKGKVVEIGDVSDQMLAGIKAGNYRIRQVPGNENALGHVKFLMPNPDDIYLHDTSSPGLFTRTQRALSHGCIRVENPQGLAEWLLRDMPEWGTERTTAALKENEPEQVILKTPIPVYVIYHTATVGDDGQVHFWKDIYKKEAPPAAGTTTDAPAQRPRG